MKYLVSLCIMLFFSRCTNKIIGNSDFRTVESNSKSLAKGYLEDLKKTSLEEVYEFCIEASPEKQKDEWGAADLENKPCKVEPLVGYSLDWAKLEGVETVKQVERYLKNDTLNLVLVTSNGDRILGTMDARKENGSWKLRGIAPHLGEDNYFEKAFKEAKKCQKMSF